MHDTGVNNLDKNLFELKLFWNDLEIIALIVECLHNFFSKGVAGFNFMNWNFFK